MNSRQTLTEVQRTSHWHHPTPHLLIVIVSSCRITSSYPSLCSAYSVWPAGLPGQQVCPIGALPSWRIRCDHRHGVLLWWLAVRRAGLRIRQEYCCRRLLPPPCSIFPFLSFPPGLTRHDRQATTKMINSTNEQKAAAKCFQNQEKLFLRDVKVCGPCWLLVSLLEWSTAAAARLEGKDVSLFVGLQRVSC